MVDPYSVPEVELDRSTVFCRDCGTKISENVLTCPSCGAPQNIGGKSKVVAGLLAIFTGAFGLHRFYLGQWWGIFYLLFFWTWIPSLVSLVEGIVFLVSNDQKWNAKYGHTKGSSAVVLIAVMFVAVFIIGILAAIAIPAYNSYVEKAQIEAQK